VPTSCPWCRTPAPPTRHLDNFTKALQDNHMIPLIFTANGLSWSGSDAGNVVAAVSAAGPDPKVGGFTFPMEFTPEGPGWLSRKTADMLLVFGDSPGTPAPLPPPPPGPPPPAPPTPPR
jgi:hypothetical protein